MISPEKERRGRIWKETAATAHARVSSGGGGARKTKTDRWDPPVSDSERARADGCGLGRLGPGERERRFWADFRLKAKRDF